MSAPTLIAPDVHGFTASHIRPEDLGIAMDIMVNQYTHPHLAVVRELVTNALDAHTEAEQTRPVQLLLITDESGSTALHVRDWGLGMSCEEIVINIGSPAASTKREDVTLTGKIGIGAKSPYAITERYTVISTCDGITSTVTFARVDGFPAHRIEDVRPAEAGAPSGTEFIVPLPSPADTVQIAAAIDQILPAWSSDQVEFIRVRHDAKVEGFIEDESGNTKRWREQLDTSFSMHLREDGSETGPDDPTAWHLQAGVIKATNRITLMMGNIPYRIENAEQYSILDILGVATENLSVVITAPNKRFDVARTRESLILTHEDTTLISNMMTAWREQINRRIAQRMESSPSALAFAHELGAPQHHEQTEWEVRINATKLYYSTLDNYARLEFANTRTTSELNFFVVDPTTDKATQRATFDLNSRHHCAGALIYDIAQLLADENALIFDRDQLTAAAERRSTALAKSSGQPILAISRTQATQSPITWEIKRHRAKNTSAEMVLMTKDEADSISWADPSLLAPIPMSDEEKKRRRAERAAVREQNEVEKVRGATSGCVRGSDLGHFMKKPHRVSGHELAAILSADPTHKVAISLHGSKSYVEEPDSMTIILLYPSERFMTSIADLREEHADQFVDATRFSKTDWINLKRSNLPGILTAECYAAHIVAAYLDRQMIEIRGVYDHVELDSDTSETLRDMLRSGTLPKKLQKTLAPVQDILELTLHDYTAMSNNDLKAHHTRDIVAEIVQERHPILSDPLIAMTIAQAIGHRSPYNAGDISQKEARALLEMIAIAITASTTDD